MMTSGVCVGKRTQAVHPLEVWAQKGSCIAFPTFCWPEQDKDQGRFQGRKIDSPFRRKDVERREAKERRNQGHSPIGTSQHPKMGDHIHVYLQKIYGQLFPEQLCSMKSLPIPVSECWIIAPRGTIGLGHNSFITLNAFFVVDVCLSISLWDKPVSSAQKACSSVKPFSGITLSTDL